MIINGMQRQIILATAGIPAEVLGEPSDAAYKCPLASWLTDDFHGWYFRALEAFGIRDYVAESGDCDDFTRLFVALACIAHRRTPDGKGYGLPVGQLSLAMAPNAPAGAQQWHSLVWACTADKGLIFIEPQVLHQTERLTRDQLASCTRCTD